MNPKISVVIPIYNIENYIRQCVDSVLQQSYENLEILLVDDGSSDSCPAICDAYAANDDRVIVLHKPNGGLSDARNYGSVRASGEFIFFLDGDDWLTSNAIESLVTVALNHKVDIVQGAFYYAYTSYLLLDDAREQTYGKLLFLPRVKAMEELIRNRAIKNFAWGKLIRTELVKSHWFIKGVFFEDSYWMYQLIHDIECYAISPVPVCYYRQREESISGTFSLRNLDLLKGVEKRTLFVKSHYPQLATLAFNSFWQLAFSFYRMSKKSEKDIADSYHSYWTYMNTNYQLDFNRSQMDSMYVHVLYILNRYSQFLLEVFLLFKRIFDRCHSSKLVLIPYKDIKTELNR